jgi:hypothetical protein
MKQRKSKVQRFQLAERKNDSVESQVDQSIHSRCNSKALNPALAISLASPVEQTIAAVIDTIDVAVLASTDEIGRQISTGHPDRNSITRYLTRQQE